MNYFSFRHRNFGFGKGLVFAGKIAVRHRYGGGHFATVAAHATRWSAAVDFLVTVGIQDARAINQAALDAYAQFVKFLVETDEIELDYAVNLLSTANVVISALRGDDQIWVSPAERVGNRDRIRRTVPGGMDLEVVTACTTKLDGAGMLRAAAALPLVRSFGFRLREILLADLPRLVSEATLRSKINVIDGTKGGRCADRLVPVGPSGLAALTAANSLATGSSRNLLHADERFVDLYHGEMHQARPILFAHGIAGWHDLRAAFACARYEVLVGHPAPVIAGRVFDKERDRAARQTIAQELGHGRTDVVGAYIGGVK